jgi:hypothetical protein
LLVVVAAEKVEERLLPRTLITLVRCPANPNPV